MKLSFSPNAFRKSSLDEALESIASIGYNGVEIMCDRPHCYPPDFSTSFINRLQTKLFQLHLTIANLNAFMLCAIGDFHHPSWIESDKNKREQRLLHTKNCIMLAAQLGARTISTEPGGPVESGQNPAELLDIFEAGLRQILPIAEKNKVKILIEPEPGLLIERSGQLDKFLKQFDSPAIGINLDLGHFFCVGEDLPALIKHWHNRIDHIHIEDIVADRRHHHLIPGLGAIDFKPVFEALRSINYQGWLTVELYPYQDNPVTAARQAFDYSRNILVMSETKSYDCQNSFSHTHR